MIPRIGWLASPEAMISSATRSTISTGVAKPIPSTPTLLTPIGLVVFALFTALFVLAALLVDDWLGLPGLLPEGARIVVSTLLIVLGVVVDDAIIIGESAYTHIRKDGHNIDNVVRGARKVAVPATFGVLTTIAAFAPMLFVGGVVGPFFAAMSVVVILCLLFSLVESKLILPAHLVHANIKPVDEEDLFNPQRTIGLLERAQSDREGRNQHAADHAQQRSHSKRIGDRVTRHCGLSFV